MRNRYKANVIFVVVFIVAMLLFAWWASGEIYNPRPTKTPTVVIPTRVTAVWETATPTIVATPIPSSTNTPVVPTATPTSTFAPVIVETPTQVPVYVYPVVDCEMLVFRGNRAIHYYRCLNIGYRAKFTIGFTPSPIFIPYGWMK